MVESGLGLLQKMSRARKATLACIVPPYYVLPYVSVHRVGPEPPGMLGMEYLGAPLNYLHKFNIWPVFFSVLLPW